MEHYDEDVTLLRRNGNPDLMDINGQWTSMDQRGLVQSNLCRWLGLIALCKTKICIFFYLTSWLTKCCWCTAGPCPSTNPWASLTIILFQLFRVFSLAGIIDRLAGIIEKKTARLKGQKILMFFITWGFSYFLLDSSRLKPNSCKNFF